VNRGYGRERKRRGASSVYPHFFPGGGEGSAWGVIRGADGGGV
jgi:hypothetical protein